MKLMDFTQHRHVSLNASYGKDFGLPKGCVIERQNGQIAGVLFCGEIFSELLHFAPCKIASIFMFITKFGSQADNLWFRIFRIVHMSMHMLILIGYKGLLVHLQKKLLTSFGNKN